MFLVIHLPIYKYMFLKVLLSTFLSFYSIYFFLNLILPKKIMKANIMKTKIVLKMMYDPKDHTRSHSILSNIYMNAITMKTIFFH